MAKSGDTVVVKETGETFTFMKTGADTNGKLLRAYMHIAPGGGAKGAPIHVHPIQEERFYIKKGQITFYLNGDVFTRGEGEAVIVPPGAAHTWENKTAETAEFVLEFEPALQWDKVFESFAARSQQGKLSANGRVSLLQMAVVLDTYRDHLYAAALPVGLQKAAFAVLALFGRMLGYEADLTYKSDSGQQPALASSSV